MRQEHYLGALILLCLNAALGIAIEVNCKEVAEKQCEKKSKYYDSEQYDELLCGNLHYCENQTDHCFVKDPKEWNCLLRKARMMDSVSKACHSPNNSSDEVMYYVEVCVFAGGDYVCNPNCTEKGTHQMQCLNNSVEYRKTCIPSLVYCPFHEHAVGGCSMNDRIVNVQKAFFENCFTAYEQEYGKHEIWYYVDRGHSDNATLDYSPIMAVSPHQIGDFKYLHRKLCPQKLPLFAAVLITVITLLSISIVAYGALKCIQYRKRQGKRWNIVEGMQIELDTSVPVILHGDDQQGDCFEEFVPRKTRDVGSHGSNLVHDYGYGNDADSGSMDGSDPSQDDVTRTLIANHSYTGELNEELESESVDPCVRPVDPEPLKMGQANEDDAPWIGSYLKHTALE